MTKTRLELFSDGVFVIVLTLLVLDLKPPAADGWAGLVAIAPGLAVHALTFLVVGLTWLGHHNLLAAVYEIRTRTLVLNLLALFWVTLIPFGARIAADHPLGSLGIGLITACRAFYTLSFVAVTASTASRNYDNPALKPLIDRRRRRGVVIGLAVLAAAPLCAVSPWIGYASIVTVFLNAIYRVRFDTETAARGEAADNAEAPDGPAAA